ncbi:MAG TPA: hypothetical protein VMU48_04900 [Terracidiphilus sp.]|nr:hypothetical protein [Terracidiphilus sp.]
MGCTALRIVSAGFLETQGTIHGVVHLAGVRIFLSIILPPTDGTERHGRGRFQCPVTAARTAVTSLYGFHVHVDEFMG